MNVVLYGENYKYWTLTERGRHALARSSTELSIGPSQLRWDGDSLTIDINETTAPIPRRVQGTIRVHFDGIDNEPCILDPEGNHRWWPLAPRARIEVAMQRPELSWQGRAYHDANAGDVPLERSFRTWNWSRADLPDRTVISYDVVRRDGSLVNLRLGSQGRGTHVAESSSQLIAVELPRTLWRVTRTVRALPGEQVQVLRTLEDAPFYSRSLLELQSTGKATRAVHESLDLDRFDQLWVQALLGFRTPRTIF